MPYFLTDCMEMKPRRGRTVLIFLSVTLLVLDVRASDILPSAATETISRSNEDFATRDRASHVLGRRLSAADVEALRAFLLRKPTDDAASADELASLKNNVADALLTQAELPADLLATFEAAFADEAQGEIWREYVVQKIPELVKRAPDDEKVRGLAFLQERLGDTNYIYAGTALLGIQRLHENSPEMVPGREVSEVARRILHAEGYAQASKISALQILARHEQEEARVRARQMLADEAPIMLRVSALATLGDVGEATDREVLSRYASSPELRLRTASKAALAKLKQE